HQKCKIMRFKFIKPFVTCLLIFLFNTALFAQATITVNGVVSDANEPLAGVTVVEQGTLNGTTTNVNGEYSLTVNDDAVIVFSFIGFTSQQIEIVKNKTQYNVTLVNDDVWLDELVVVGYGVQQKKLITGATIQVKGDDIEKLNTSSVLGALQ